MTGTLYRLAAFTTDPHGGNPAGVWLGRLDGAGCSRRPSRLEVAIPATGGIEVSGTAVDLAPA